jgi:AcrR family transcriptional regulator
MASIDHRTRVAAAKRERTRTRLVDSALRVFADKGVDHAVIDDVIALANVSRGTFYNYFKTNEELLDAVVSELANELFSFVDLAIAQYKDPAERLSCAMRMILDTAISHPQLARFATRVGFDLIASNSLSVGYPFRDLRAGIASGSFALVDPQIGLDLFVGMAQLALLNLIARPDLPKTYVEDIAFHMLLSLGVSAVRARQLVSQPLNVIPLPSQSLLARTLG